MSLIAHILNSPWSLLGILCALFSIPNKISLHKNPFALIFYVKSFWWYRWLPGKRGVRAMVNGNTILLGPTADEKDLVHELIHVRQFVKEPFIHPFFYTFQTFKHGYRNNKYEVKAYSKSGSKYTI